MARNQAPSTRISSPKGALIGDGVNSIRTTGEEPGSSRTFFLLRSVGLNHEDAGRGCC
jgi:hypothetical protein